MSTPHTVLGVDGCKAGWVSVSFKGKAWLGAEIFSDIRSLFDANRQASLVLIDIPIGLRECGSRERTCDLVARKLVGRARASSIFRVPTRQAVYARSYSEALHINRKLTGRGFSIQAWNIIPKIREVDELVRSSEKARRTIKESHPELCFCMFAGKSLRFPKRTPEGRRERIAVLESLIADISSLIEKAAASLQGKFSEDDLIDAFVLGLAAKSPSLITIPTFPEKDSLGNPMQMVCPRSRAMLKKILSFETNCLK